MENAWKPGEYAVYDASPVSVSGTGFVADAGGGMWIFAVAAAIFILFSVFDAYAGS